MHHSHPHRPLLRAAAGPPWATAIAVTVSLGVCWGLPEILQPSVAQAYTSQVSVLLYSPPNESYETLLNRSHLAARAAVQRSFDADLLVSEAWVTIVADRDGITVPIMEVQVSRSAWRNRPDAAYWGNYFLSARSLLGFPDLGGGSTTGNASNTTNRSTAPAADPGSSSVVPVDADPAANSTNGDPGATDPEANPVNGDPGATDTRLDRLPGVPVTLPADPFNALPQ